MNGGVWKLVRDQHGVVTRQQLLTLGLTPRAIEHRLANGRLHSVMRGVYTVGRAELTPHGRWMAAVLSHGPEAALSHGSAAALWGIGLEESAEIEVSIRSPSGSHRPGIRIHRRPSLRDSSFGSRDGIPVTSVVQTLVDLAADQRNARIEHSVSEADRLDLIDPEALRSALADHRGQPGARRLQRILDRRTFRLTDSELERRFLDLVREAGLPVPLTRRRLNGFTVDFFWPKLGLVVETDGLRYHRTPIQQARDQRRDQVHTAAGLTALRFSHAQVCFETTEVRSILLAVARRLTQRAA
jgi:very-short-patch-repair endonuclease